MSGQTTQMSKRPTALILVSCALVIGAGALVFFLRSGGSASSTPAPRPLPFQQAAAVEVSPATTEADVENLLRNAFVKQEYFNALEAPQQAALLRQITGLVHARIAGDLDAYLRHVESLGGRLPERFTPADVDAVRHKMWKEEMLWRSIDAGALAVRDVEYVDLPDGRYWKMPAPEATDAQRVVTIDAAIVFDADPNELAKQGQPTVDVLMPIKGERPDGSLDTMYTHYIYVWWPERQAWVPWKAVVIMDGKSRAVFF